MKKEKNCFNLSKPTHHHRDNKGRWAGRGGAQGKGVGSKRAGILAGLSLCLRQAPGTGSGWPGWLPCTVLTWGGVGREEAPPWTAWGRDTAPPILPKRTAASVVPSDFFCAHQGPVLCLPVEECSRCAPPAHGSARAWHGLRSAGTPLRISRFPGQTQLHLPSKSSLLLLLPAPPP